MKKKNKDLSRYEILKLFALFTPLILSVIILIIVVIYCIPIKQPVICYISDDTQINIALSIIGIAITVWVGLNIYNVVERKEFEEIKKLYERLKNLNDKQRKDFKEIKAAYDDLSKTIKKQDLKLELHDLHTIWLDMYTLSLQFMDRCKPYEVDKIYKDKVLEDYANELDERIDGIIKAFKNKEEKIQENDMGWYFKQIEILVLYLKYSLELKQWGYEKNIDQTVNRLLKEIKRILYKDTNVLKNDLKILKGCRDLFEAYKIVYDILNNIKSDFKQIIRNSNLFINMLNELTNRIELFNDIN